MKTSLILRYAAKALEDGKAEGMCLATNAARCALGGGAGAVAAEMAADALVRALYRNDALRESEQRMDPYNLSLSARARERGGTAYWFGDPTDPVYNKERILALLFAAELADTEGL